MEWSLYPELAQTLGTNSQGLFNFDPAGTMGASPNGSDESELVSDLLADPDHPTLHVPDMLAWESWDLGGLGAGSTTTAATPPSDPCPTTVLAHAGGIYSSGQHVHASSAAGATTSSTACSNIAPPPRSTHTRRCSSPANPCIIAAASAVGALHSCADMCLSSPSSSSSSSSPLSWSSTSSSTTHQYQHQHHPPGPGPSPGPGGATAPQRPITPTIDAVLTSTRAAALALSATLHCGACSTQPQLHLLAATALEKLAGWYRAVACGMVLSSSSSSSSSSTTTTKTAAAATTITITGGGGGHGVSLDDDDPFPSLPAVAIGSHAVEEAGLRAAVVAQVVMQRLRELRAVAELLARRMGEASSSTTTMAGSAAAAAALGGCGGGGLYYDGDGSSIHMRSTAGSDGRHGLPEAVRAKLVARVRQCLLAAWEAALAVLRDMEGRDSSLY